MCAPHAWSHPTRYPAVNVRILHTFWRLAAGLAGIAILIGGIVLLAHALDVLGPFRAMWGGGGMRFSLDLAAYPMRVRWVWAAAGLGIALLGALLIALALVRTTEQRERSRRIRLSGHARNGLYGSGEVTVSMRSLYALVVHTAERDPAVREADPTLRLRRGGWHLACRLVVTPDAEIPEVASRLKPQLAEALERHTGLPVAAIDLDLQLFALDARTRVH